MRSGSSASYLGITISDLKRVCLYLGSPTGGERLKQLEEMCHWLQTLAMQLPHMTVPVEPVPAKAYLWPSLLGLLIWQQRMVDAVFKRIRGEEAWHRRWAAGLGWAGLGWAKAGLGRGLGTAGGTRRKPAPDPAPPRPRRARPQAPP